MKLKHIVFLVMIFFMLAFDVSPVSGSSTFHMLDANHVSFDMVAKDCHFTDIPHKVSCVVDDRLIVSFDNIIGLSQQSVHEDKIVPSWIIATAGVFLLVLAAALIGFLIEYLLKK